jgi:hypothetical protein
MAVHVDAVGLACARAFGASPAVAPTASAAAPPLSSARRLTGVAENGSVQQEQLANSLCPDCLSMVASSDRLGSATEVATRFARLDFIGQAGRTRT